MEDMQLKSQLKRGTLLVVIACTVLILLNVLSITNVFRSFDNIIYNQIHTEGQEYRKRIETQIKNDVSTIKYIATFIDKYSVYDTNEIMSSIYETNSYNDFVAMSYFDVSKQSGIVVTQADREGKSVLLNDYDETVQDIIRQAENGNDGISRLYLSEYSKQRVITYSTPVYADGELIGVLLASDSIGIFSDILSGNTVLNGSGNIHLISSTGDFLILSNEELIENKWNNLFDGNIFSNENELKIRNALNSGYSTEAEFEYRGIGYKVVIEPIGINGWNLVCISNDKGTDSILIGLVQMVGFTFFGILLLSLLSILYSYKIMYKSHKSLRETAYRDPVTGFDNYNSFEIKLKNSIDNEEAGSLMALNIRKFKFINEIFGKQIANKLLSLISEAINDDLRSGEYFCREAADRFYVFVLSQNVIELELRTQNILSLIEDNLKNYEVTNYKIYFYIGISSLEFNESKTVDEALTHTLLAIGKAKEKSNNSLCFYNADLHTYEELENFIESHMYQALDNQEFKMHLQPKMNLHTGKIGGAEALVRWSSPDRLIYPNQFIPTFEQNGFCIELDLYMLDKACKQIRDWIDSGITPINISVNQSKLLFFKSNYIDMVKDILNKYSIPKNCITLEILEGLAIDNVDELNRKIVKLKELGIRISMDDFGSGYSSLNSLGKLNLDELKLDKGFLDSLSENTERYGIIMRNTVSIAKQLNMEVVVEGVETADNEQFIAELGCDYGQGYLYSKPITAEEFSNKYMRNTSKE